MNTFGRYTKAALLACSLMSAGIARAYDFIEEGIYYQRIATEASDANSETVAVTYGESSNATYSGSVVIPATVTHGGVTYTVTAIERSAFNACPYLVSVTIPETVTTIAYQAFNGCTGLKDVYISDIDSWTNISFAGLTSNPLYYALRLNLDGQVVTDVEMGTAKPYCFVNYTRLKSVKFNDSATSIGTYAFSGCSRLENVTIPKNITSINSGSFGYCNSLETVIFEDGNAPLTMNATFDHSKNIKTLYIGRNVTLKSYYHEYVGTFADMVFPNRVEKVVLGDSLTVLPVSMFNGNADVIEISPGLKSLRAYFSQSYNGRGAGQYYNAHVNVLDWEAWFGIEWMSLYSNPLMSASSAAGYSLSINGVPQTEIVVPESVTEIKDYTFPSLVGVDRFTILGDVSTIGENYSIPRVKTIDIGRSALPAELLSKYVSYQVKELLVSNSNPEYMSVDGILYSKDGKSLCMSPRGKSGILFIPEGVTTIKASAMTNTDYSGIVLPSTLRTIEDNAFSTYNSNMRYVYNLSPLNIMPGTTSPGNIAYTGAKVFKNYLIENGFMFAEDTDHTVYMTAYVGEDENVVLPMSYKGITYTTPPYTIAKYAFQNSPSVKKITVPYGFTTLDDWCFAYTSANEILLPPTLTTIGNSVFSSSRVMSITLPASVTSVGTGMSCFLQIVCEGVTPPTAYYSYSNGSSFASSTSYNPKVYVRNASAVEAYKNATGWANCVIETVPAYATITLNANGGTCGAESMVRYVGQTFGSLPIPERDGYNFDRWGISSPNFTNFNGTFVDENTTVRLYDMTLMAYWTVKRTDASQTVQQPTTENPTTVYNTYSVGYQWYYKYGTKIEGATESTLNLALVDGESEVYCQNPYYTDSYYNDAYRTNTIYVNPPKVEHWRPQSSSGTPEAVAYVDFTFNGKAPRPVGRWQLGAFVNGTCVGLGEFRAASVGSYWEVPICSRVTYDDVVFKLFDAATGKEYVGSIDGRGTVGDRGFGSPEEPIGVIFADVYTINYVVDGEVYEQVEVGAGAKVVLIDNPERAGYRFGGWSSAPSVMPENDITITGRFSPYTDLTMTLPAGWSWVSYNTVAGVPLTVFGDALECIMSQDGVTINDPMLGLVSDNGGSESIGLKGYKVKLSSPTRVAVQASAKRYDTAQTLHRGWNWVCAIVPELSAIDAISHADGAGFVDGDIISSQTAFATYTGGAWVGTLKSVCPGEGYMIKCREDSVSLVFDEQRIAAVARQEMCHADGGGGSSTSLVHADDINVHEFGDVMNIIAVIDRESLDSGLSTLDSGLTVLAMHGSELRGVGEVIDGRVFMTVHGNPGEEIKLISRSVTGIFTCQGPLMFESDVVGTFNDPLRLTFVRASGVDDIVGDTENEGLVYDLSGRLRASKPINGLYIQNGLKKK